MPVPPPATQRQIPPQLLVMAQNVRESRTRRHPPRQGRSVDVRQHVEELRVVEDAEARSEAGVAHGVARGGEVDVAEGQGAVRMTDEGAEPPPPPIAPLSPSLSPPVVVVVAVAVAVVVIVVVVVVRREGRQARTPRAVPAVCATGGLDLQLAHAATSMIGCRRRRRRSRSSRETTAFPVVSVVVGRGRRTSSLFRHRVVWFTERIDGVVGGCSGELSTILFSRGNHISKTGGNPT